MRILVMLLMFASIAHAENASCYGGEKRHNLCGSMTASGERFDCRAMTAAHRTLAFGTWVRVCHGERCIVVRINDRGPYVNGRIIDLSQGACHRLGLPGLGTVSVETLSHLYIPKGHEWGLF